MFQSTHPRGVRPAPRGTLFSVPACFNPRTRVGCDTSPHTSSAGGLCFNPRTRVGCDRARCGAGLWSGRFQSTHPRGVRPGHMAGRVQQQAVSIHAPAWGATSVLISSMISRSCFNPRTRVGCDAWRRTGPAGQKGFNPRTRVGCDFNEAEIVKFLRKFQSTHPRGVRRPAVTPGAPAHQVSIHAPAWGATLAISNINYRLDVFQSTHPRGVRPI